jgi:small-conductance mechanosensitive channel
MHRVRALPRWIPWIGAALLLAALFGVVVAQRAHWWFWPLAGLFVVLVVGAAFATLQQMQHQRRYQRRRARRRLPAQAEQTPPLDETERLLHELLGIETPPSAARSARRSTRH